MLPSLTDGKLDIKKFRPTANQLIKMTPGEKQELVNKLKYV